MFKCEWDATLSHVPTYTKQSAKNTQKFSIYINAGNLCFFNVFAASFRLNRWKIRNRAAADQHRRTFLENLLPFRLLASLFCSAKLPRIYVCELDFIGFWEVEFVSRPSLSILLVPPRFPLFLRSISRFLKGFVMNFEGFHSNSSLHFHLLGATIAKLNEI